MKIDGKQLKNVFFCGFRLTGVSGSPVITADNAALTTIYLTPYLHNAISLYNGSIWVVRQSAEVSLAVTGRTADLPFDIFAYDNAGVVTLEFLDWTNATTRATALVRQDGVWCKTGALTRRYLGTCRPRSATTFAWVTAGVDAPAKLDLWNMYNRVRTPFSCVTTTDTWTYTTATVRQAQGSANYQADILAGLQEDAIDATLVVTTSQSAASNRAAGIGYDSTTVFSGVWSNLTAAAAGSITARLTKQPAAGSHYLAWLEYAVASGTATWYGDNGGVVMQSGLTGLWLC